MKQEKQGLSVLKSPAHLRMGSKAHISSNKQTLFRNNCSNSELPSPSSFSPPSPTHPPHNNNQNIKFSFKTTEISAESARSLGKLPKSSLCFCLDDWLPRGWQGESPGHPPAARRGSCPAPTASPRLGQAVPRHWLPFCRAPCGKSILSGRERPKARKSSSNAYNDR